MPIADHTPGSAEGNQFLAAALDYARRGWAVFPLGPRQKTPLTEHGFKDATVDETQIRRWWSDNPYANVGLATGEVSGIDVIDADEKSGGPTSIEELQKVRGSLPAGPCSRTGAGFHLLVAHTPGARNSQNRLGRGVDVRADGGYVVAPPSVHPNGKTYQWLDGRTPDQVAVPEPPPWLAEMLLAPAGLAVVGGGAAATGAGEEERLIALAEQAEPLELDAVPELADERWAELRLLISTGQRAIADNEAPKTDKNEILFDAACWLVRAGIDEARAIGLLKNRGHFRYNGLDLHHAYKPAHDTPRKQLRAVARAIMNARQKVAAEAPPQGAPPWDLVNKLGEPQRSYNNARSAILRLGITCEHDTFKDRYVIGGHAVQEWAGELSDNALVMLRQLIYDTFGFDPGDKNVHDAAVQLCVSNPRHPIREYLDGLVWDGTPRLERWLSNYLGAEDTPLNRGVSKIVMVAAVQRVRQPGCKFDTVPFLIGPQGTGKSSAIEELAGEKYFSDEDLLSANTKEKAELTQGVWIFEIGDLAGWSNADVNKMKAYASRREDRCRPAYGRRRVDRPRQFIMVASTNEQRFLRDTTGNRRYVPIQTGTIDLAALRRDRDQLWAEAAALEAQGESTTLPRDLWGAAASAQEAAMEADPWCDLLENVEGEECWNELGQLMERVRSAWVMEHRLNLNGAVLKGPMSQRLGHVMRSLGWQGPELLSFGAASKSRGYERSAWCCSCCCGPAPFASAEEYEKALRESEQ